MPRLTRRPGWPCSLLSTTYRIACMQGAGGGREEHVDGAALTQVGGAEEALRLVLGEAHTMQSRERREHARELGR